MAIAEDRIISVPISGITLVGLIAMDAVTITLPLYYARKTGKYALAGAGYTILYGGLFISTLLFKFTPEAMQRVILAAMLIASPVAMLVSFLLSSGYMRKRADYVLEAIALAPQGAPPEAFLTERKKKALRRTFELAAAAADRSVKKGFSPVEQEIAALLCENFTRRDISRKLHLAASEMDGHLKGIRLKIAWQPDDGTGERCAAVAEAYELTRRETEFLQALCGGVTNAELAASFCVAETTVKFHIGNLLKKLPVKNRAQIPEWVAGYPPSDK